LIALCNSFLITFDWLYTSERIEVRPIFTPTARKAMKAMSKRNFWLVPTGVVVGVIAAVVGFALRASKVVQVTECGTKLGQVHQLVSAPFRAVCTSAKSLTSVGMGLLVIGGIVAAIAVIVWITHFVSSQNPKAA
jgi:hypothetical protein